MACRMARRAGRAPRRRTCYRADETEVRVPFFFSIYACSPYRPPRPLPHRTSGLFLALPLLIRSTASTTSGHNTVQSVSLLLEEHIRMASILDNTSFFLAMAKIVGTLRPMSRCVNTISACLMPGICIYALLGVVSSVNQHIIDAPTENHSIASKKQSIPWGLVVSVLKDVEAVVEVAAQHFVGDDRKWSFLAVTEAVKAGVRLAAFRESGYKMLLQGGEVANEEEVTVLENNYGVNGNGVPAIYPMDGHAGNGHKAMTKGLDGKNGFVSKSLEKRAVAALNKFGENTKMMSDPMWMRRLQPTPEPTVMVAEKPTLASIWSAKGGTGRLFVLGEVVHIFRPLVYVLLIRKFGIKSWTPWLVSLAVELTSLGIHSHATDLSHRLGKVHQLSSAERDELKRRKMMWALYLMRDPFFASYTKRHLQKAEQVLNPVPLIGFLTGKLIELLEAVQTRYTYTSGS